MKNISCKFNKCNVKVSKLIGLCKHCKKYYCTFHRIPETHSCENLDILKEQTRLKLLQKLMDEKTVKSFF